MLSKIDLLPEITPLARFFISDPRGATCVCAARDHSLKSSPIGQFVDYCHKLPHSPRLLPPS